jgi:hypothetical protein
MRGIMFRSVLRNPPDFKISAIGDDEQEGHMVSVLVAENVATTQQAFVESMLVYVYDAEFWEFSFTITVIALDEGSEDFTTQDRTIARGFIPSSIRKSIIGIVCTSLRLLLEIEKPARVYRVTKGRNLPKKAMRKHHLITAVLVQSGYHIEEAGTDEFRRTFWLLARNGD